MKPVFGWPVLFSASLLSVALGGNALAEARIPSTLACSAANERAGAYTTHLFFTFANKTLKAERSTGRRPGKEVFSGSVGANSVININGRGGFSDGSNRWRLTFSGALNDTGPTVLKGTLEGENGAYRTCSIEFMLPPDQLASIILPPEVLNKRKLETLSKTLAEKEKALQAAQDELKKQQVNAAQELAEKDEALQEAQDETAKLQADAARELAAKENALKSAQDDLKKLQAGAARDLAEKENALRTAQDELKKLQTAAARDLADKEKALQAARDDLKKQQANAAHDAAERALAEKEKALRAEQEDLKRQQADAIRGLAEKEKALQVAQDTSKKQQDNAARELAEKEQALQAAQNELKKRQADAEHDAAERVLAEKDKALRAAQEDLKRQQAVAAQELAEKEKALQAAQEELKRQKADAAHAGVASPIDEAKSKPQPLGIPQTSKQRGEEPPTATETKRPMTETIKTVQDERTKIDAGVDANKPVSVLARAYVAYISVKKCHDANVDNSTNYLSSQELDQAQNAVSILEEKLVAADPTLDTKAAWSNANTTVNNDTAPITAASCQLALQTIMKGLHVSNPKGNVPKKDF